MKVKQNFSVKPIGKYLREVSVVVIGVAVTVGIGLWINNSNIRKDHKQYLDAIILELKENAEKFDDYARKLQRSVRYSNYLHSLHDIKSLNKDSIQYYAGNSIDGDIGWGNWDPVTLYNNDAFEMFKSSGAMRQIEDKELLLSLWKVYHLMESTQNLIDDCLQYKKEIGMMDIQRIDDGKQIVVRMNWFYINDVPLDMKQDCEAAAEFIRETVSKLENSKIVKK
jgi:hypothetical protein